MVEIFFLRRLLEGLTQDKVGVNRIQYGAHGLDARENAIDAGEASCNFTVLELIAKSEFNAPSFRCASSLEYLSPRRSDAFHCEHLLWKSLEECVIAQQKNLTISNSLKTEKVLNLGRKVNSRAHCSCQVSLTKSATLISIVLDSPLCLMAICSGHCS